VILVEERRKFNNPKVWHDVPVAKFTYVKSIDLWRLFCMLRDLAWHGYAPLPQSKDLGTLVEAVEKDPTAIFWG